MLSLNTLLNNKIKKIKKYGLRNILNKKDQKCYLWQQAVLAAKL